jgi:hypothetical protein
MATLTIKHDLKRTKNGDVVLVKASRTQVVDIVAVYADGSVRTKSGDVWLARKLESGNYETTN